MIKFETNSKIGNCVVALIACGPKKGILNKVTWSVVTFGAVVAWYVDDFAKACKKKLQKSGVQ